MTNAIDSQLTNLYDGTILWPMIALSNIAQGSAVLAMSVLQKKNERAQQVNIPACISCYLGVTEPALFGVNLKYGFPLICGMAGSCIAAMISVGSGVQAFSIGVGGLPGILSIKPEFYLYFLLAMAVAIVVPFLLTLIVGKKKLSNTDFLGEDIEMTAADTEKSEADTAKEGAAEGIATAPKEEALTELKAGLSGKVIPLDDVPDNVFSQHVMGDGIAIEPSSDTVVAPADATVNAVMADTGHACGLTFANGMELLIHVGVDTVDMNGEGFALLVEEGQKVRAGEGLIRFDKEKIHAAGHPSVTVFIVTEEGSAKNIEYLSGMEAEAGETPVIRFE